MGVVSYSYSKQRGMGSGSAYWFPMRAVRRRQSRLGQLDLMLRLSYRVRTPAVASSLAQSSQGRGRGGEQVRPKRGRLTGTQAHSKELYMWGQNENEDLKDGEQPPPSAMSVRTRCTNRLLRHSVSDRLAWMTYIEDDGDDEHN